MTSLDIHTDPFFDVPREVVSTSAGDIELPIFYFDGFAGTALFAIDAERAANMLQGTTLTPLEHQGTATAAITFYNYRDTSLGPYQEVALAILVTPQAAPSTANSSTGDSTGDSTGKNKESGGQPGNYIVDLPVTTLLANVVGRELWGYPKFVADISIDAEGEEFHGRLCDETGERILTLSGRPGSPIKRNTPVKQNTPAKDIVTYSQTIKRKTSQNVQLLRTTIPTTCRWDALEPGSLALTIGDSGHAMTSRLRELGLAGAKPLRWQTARAFRSRLPRGESV